MWIAYAPPTLTPSRNKITIDNRENNTFTATIVFMDQTITTQVAPNACTEIELPLRGYGFTIAKIYDGKGRVAVVPVLFDESEDIVYLPRTAKIYYIGGGIVTSEISDKARVSPNGAWITIVTWPGHMEIYYRGSRIADINGGSTIIEMIIDVDGKLAPAYLGYIPVSIREYVLEDPEDLAPLIGGVNIVKAIVEQTKWQLVGCYVERLDNGLRIHAYYIVDLKSDVSQWIRILAIASGIAAGIVLAALSMGIAIPAETVIVDSIAAIAFNTLAIFTNKSESVPKTIVSEATRIYAKAVNKLEEYRNNILSYLSKLHNEGKISDEAYKNLVAYVNQVINYSEEKLAELKNLVTKAYEEGKKDQWEADKNYIIVAGVGGFIIGALVGAKI